MTTKTKYSVTHEGQTFTRTTDRAYLFAVTCKPSYEREMAFETDPAHGKTDRSNYAYYCERVRLNDFQYTDEQKARQVAAMTRDEYVAHMQARRVAALEERKAAGRFDRFFEPTWTSRRDLAEKEAARLRNAGHLDVVILPVEQPVLKLSGRMVEIKPESSLHFVPGV